MNFFEAQDKTRRKTRWLVVMFFVATLMIVVAVTAVIAITTSGPQLMQGAVSLDGAMLQQDGLRLALIAAGVLAFILLASLYRIARLSTGGAQVAQEMGGTLVSADVQDPLRQRLRNVVEEMAIASGVPVPQIFVMEEESSINAFAAGFSPADAAVAVTRGTLEQLNREQLQGVIAHEFSHILNGDMRLNIRLMGVLFGIISIGQIGRMLMRVSSNRGIRIGSANRRGSASAFVFVGIALFIVGSLGILMARLIRAGVSRQREYLADASAVQFTRQTEGIAGALKKIAGFDAGSRIRVADPEEVSHMLFANGARTSFLRAMASHPPLPDRIKALDPSFELEQVSKTSSRSPRGPMSDESSAISGFAEQATATSAIDSNSVVAGAGHPDHAQIEHAGALRRSIPFALYDAAHSREWAFYLVLSLTLDSESGIRDAQLTMLESRLGQMRTAKVKSYGEQIDALGPRYRLTLLELCFPALKERPAGQLHFLLELVDELAALGSANDLSQFAFRRTLHAYLEDAVTPAMSSRRKITHFGKRHSAIAAAELLWIVAAAGHESADEQEQAYQSGMACLHLPSGLSPQRKSIEHADELLGQLRGLIGRDMEKLLKGLVATISHDGRVTVSESELMRTICASLSCPLPPIIGR